MADNRGTAAPSHGLRVNALEAAVIHVVGQSRAFLHYVESALHEIGSLDDERAGRIVEALQLTDGQAERRSRSTVSRWFAGTPTSLPVALTIVGKLGLRFDDVYSRCEVEPES